LRHRDAESRGFSSEVALAIRTFERAAMQCDLRVWGLHFIGHALRQSFRFELGRHSSRRNVHETISPYGLLPDSSCARDEGRFSYRNFPATSDPNVRKQLNCGVLTPQQCWNNTISKSPEGAAPSDASFPSSRFRQALNRSSRCPMGATSAPPRTPYL
jgi:hypothetical protein